MFKKLFLLLWLAAEGDPQDNSDASEDAGNPVEPDTGEVSEPTTPDGIELDGEILTLDQIREYRKGHMRQADYTRKTQELARMRQEHAEAIELYEFLRNNPEIAQRLQEESPVAPAARELTVDPIIRELDMKVRTMEVEKALGLIKQAMPEADEIEILQIATDKRISVEDAFEQWKGKNLDKILEKRIKSQTEKMVDKIKENGQTTRTLMNPSLKPPTENLGLTSAEIAFARKMDMTPEEYKKYKNYKR